MKCQDAIWKRKKNNVSTWFAKTNIAWLGNSRKPPFTSCGLFSEDHSDKSTLTPSAFFPFCNNISWQTWQEELWCNQHSGAQTMNDKEDCVSFYSFTRTGSSQELWKSANSPSLRSCASILPSSGVKCFQSSLAVIEQSASVQLSKNIQKLMLKNTKWRQHRLWFQMFHFVLQLCYLCVCVCVCTPKEV